MNGKRSGVTKGNDRKTSSDSICLHILHGRLNLRLSKSNQELMEAYDQMIHVLVFFR